MFSEKALHFLTEAGWDSSLCRDTASYTDLLEKEGYTINNHVVEFLQRFGGLDCALPAFRVPNEFDRLRFDPIYACNGIYRERVEVYEQRTGESLVVVGVAYSDHLTLMISATGRVFGAYDDYLAKLGNNYVEAINSMYDCKQPSEV